MQVLAEADPEILAGIDQIDRPVRWLHPAEVTDIAHLLRGDEVVLTTGTNLPDVREEVVPYAASLADAGVVGLFVELGRKWTRIPQSVIDAFLSANLVLVALHREVRFATVVEEVGASILDARVEDLRASERIHETFTRLDLESASTEEILNAVIRLCGSPVVLESSRHQVISFANASKDTTDILSDWPRRSRAAVLSGRTGYDRRTGWLMTVVGSRGDDWGRLIVMTTSLPSRRDYVLIERAAAALTLYQMRARARDSAERNTHTALLAELRAGRVSTEVIMRCEAASFPTKSRRFFAVAVRSRINSADSKNWSLADLAAGLASSLRSLQLDGFVGIDTNHVVGLVSIQGSASAEAVMGRIAKRLHQTANVIIAQGEVVDRLDNANRTLVGAENILASTDSDDRRPWVTLEDAHLRGLLHLLQHDERLDLYVRRELSPLFEHDSKRGTSLVQLLTVVLNSRGGKTAAAKSLLLSRAVLYERLAKIESILGVDLEDPHIRTSLHVALLAHSLRPDAASETRR
ncbi:PucR family transcriptional regulator [Rhodococcus qingshengii]|uniref:PucR family transcriptional regulator n=1 Tax=Rhodococcus qingshengii TaxID=334542 RepID=A0AAW6LWP9_RHOSG|nr:PucR family transcriptional regulator [Rhodococcus qingshengii]MDE8649906.1 PucR family transcriptional regulator [Rhodococcus qingshengii]